ncbi:hypothetical protein WJX73_002314 [Symbiochloris irregularis]|uniref:Uncharacterized protein n=1 Tax=Symbiochloris irregularis TaxID=706552 RepID=A0AAW1NNS1_9CHLO
MDGIVGAHALITGGAQGIGLALAEAMAHRGAAAVSILDVSEEKLKKTAQRWANSDLRHTLLLTFATDVTDETQVREAVYSAHARCGTLDFVFANAGIGCGGVPGLSSYSASKFAVRGFIESARLEVGCFPYRVTCDRLNR